MRISVVANHGLNGAAEAVVSNSWNFPFFSRTESFLFWAKFNAKANNLSR